MAESVRTIAVVPVYNERDTGVKVLQDVLAQEVVSEVVVVDDGSTDGSGGMIAAWASGKTRVTFLRHERNKGYSEALLTAFRHLIGRMAKGEFGPRDIVVTVDADGQHDPAELPGFVSHMTGGNWDVVWVRRDFRLYPLWKRTGNALMAAIGSAFAGARYRDVESGYCLFRLGPLEHALSYRLKETRYTVSLTLAVLFGRLGYRISDEPVANIELYRSRTRVLDVLVDTRAAYRAWFAVTARDPLKTVRALVSLLILGGLAVVAALVAVKRVYQGFDSVNNYAHVWYIAKHLFHGSIPLRFDALEGGRALTYPYGFVPWTLSAALRPALGDFAVTWVTIIGVALILAVIYKTRLQRSMWLLALFVAFPFTPQLLLNFQMAFVWGLLFGFLYAHALDRGSVKWAALWLAAAALTHLLVMGPLLTVYTVWVFYRRPDMRVRLEWLGAAAAPPLGVLCWYMTLTPAVSEADFTHIVLVTMATIGQRAAVFFFPFLIRSWADSPAPALKMATGVWSAALLLALSALWNSRFATYQGLVSSARDDYAVYLGSSVFEPGATYRMVEPPGRELGQYDLIRHGAVLASEFFEESKYHQDWSPRTYACFLDAKQVDYVVLKQQYTALTKYNEEEVLESLVADGAAARVYSDPGGGFNVYDVRGAGRGSEHLPVRQCLQR